MPEALGGTGVARRIARLAAGVLGALVLAGSAVAQIPPPARPAQVAQPARDWPEPGKGASEHTVMTNCVMTPMGPRLYVKGVVDTGDAARFKAAFDSCIDSGDARTLQVWLWSPGGVVTEGISMGETIANAGDRVSTYVPAGKQCVSICTVVFLGGPSRQRFVHPSGQYVVHAFGSSMLSTDFGLQMISVEARAERALQCIEGGGSAPGCDAAPLPPSLATIVLKLAVKDARDQGTPIKSLAQLCNSKHMERLYIEARQPPAIAAELVKRSCAQQVMLSSNEMQSYGLEIQRGAAQITRLLYQYLTSPPKGVHVERLLDKWFAVTMSNTVPLTRQEISNMGVAAVLDLESPSIPAR